MAYSLTPSHQQPRGGRRRVKPGFRQSIVDPIALASSGNGRTMLASTLALTETHMRQTIAVAVAAIATVSLIRTERRPELPIPRRSRPRKWRGARFLTVRRCRSHARASTNSTSGPTSVNALGQAVLPLKCERATLSLVARSAGPCEPMRAPTRFGGFRFTTRMNTTRPSSHAPRFSARRATPYASR